MANLAGAKSGAALGPPPDDLVALVKQATIEKVLERPPDRFDVRLVIGNVGVVEFHPEAQSLGQPFPLLHVLPDRLLAKLDEWLDTMGFDFFFGVDAKLF